MAHTVFVAGKGSDSMRSFIKGLQNYSCALVIAVDGQDALRLLKKNRPPMLIALASTLETVNTKEVCQWIRQTKQFAKIPILILEEDTVDRAQYAKFSISEFLKQPYSAYDAHKMLSDLAAAGRVQPGGGMKMKNQMIGVIVAILLFIAFFSYFILMPIFEGLKMDKEKKSLGQKGAEAR